MRPRALRFKTRECISNANRYLYMKNTETVDSNAEISDDDEEEDVVKVISSKPVRLACVVARVCSTMDLIAVGCMDGSVSVYRLIVEEKVDWQKLFTAESMTIAVTALTWCPEGKKLAIGRADGKTILHLNHLIRGIHIVMCYYYVTR